MTNPTPAARDERSTIAPSASDSVAAAAAQASSGVQHIRGLLGRLAGLGSDNSANAAKCAAAPDVLTQKDVEARSEEFFAQMKEYATRELECSVGDLESLEQLNSVAAAKYAEIASTVDDLDAFAEALEAKRAELEPLLDEIDGLATSVDSLHEVAKQLDEFSLALGE